jgi:hypothetical protein
VDPVCLSRISCPDLFLYISDPGSNNNIQEHEHGELLLSYLLEATNKFHKVEIYLNFEQLQEKIWAKLLEIWSGISAEILEQSRNRVFVPARR